MGTKGSKEWAESCGATSRNSKTCLGNRPDRYVDGGVEKVRALFEIMKIGKADNGDCGGAVPKLDLKAFYEIHFCRNQRQWLSG